VIVGLVEVRVQRGLFFPTRPEDTMRPCSNTLLRPYRTRTVYGCVYVCMRAYMSVCLYVCMRVHVRVCVREHNCVELVCMCV
jgi:hypothetical protein